MMQANMVSQVLSPREQQKERLLGLSLKSLTRISRPLAATLGDLGAAHLSLISKASNTISHMMRIRAAYSLTRKEVGRVSHNLAESATQRS